MSAANAIVLPRAAWLFADTAVYDDRGKILRFHSKVSISENHRIAITCCGRIHPGSGALIREWLDAQESQHAAIKGLPQLLLDLRCLLAECATPSLWLRARSRFTKECAPEAGIRLTAAWWDSERGKGAAAVVTDADDLGPDRPTFSVHRFDGIFSPCNFDPWWSEFDFDHLEDGRRMAELQRRDTSVHPWPTVGGTFEGWRISAMGVERFEIVSWPDQVGQRILIEPLEEAA